MHRTVLPLIALLLASVSPTLAQEAKFVGVVIDSLTGDPLAGVLVRLSGHDESVLTGLDGRFELGGVTSGELSVEVLRPGFRPGSVQMEIRVSRAVTVDLGALVLSPLAVELNPVVVEATEVEAKLSRVGFFQRMSTEQGTFLTRDEIAQQNPRRTSELFKRIPGFQVAGDGMVSSRRGIPGMSQGFSRCNVEYYIDGVHADGSRVDDVMVHAIVGMEVYTGAATIPQAFRVAGNARCGVVVLWTRTGGRREPPGGR